MEATGTLPSLRKSLGEFDAARVERTACSRVMTAVGIAVAELQPKSVWFGLADSLVDAEFEAHR